MSNVLKVLIAIVLIAAIVAGVLLFFNEQNKEKGLVNESGEVIEIEANDSGEKVETTLERLSFEERIKPYNDYINNAELSESLIDVDHYISYAELSKKDSDYNLHIVISSDGEEYSEEEVNKVQEQLKNNNTAVLDGKYTFYKNKDLLLSAKDWSEYEKELINNEYHESENNLFTFKLDDSDYINVGTLFYTIKTNDGKVYKAYGMNEAGASYYDLSSKVLNEFDITLYADDILVPTIESKEEYTVEEYYKKIENNESIKVNDDANYIFETELGISRDPYGGPFDAIWFEEGKTYINFFTGGV